MDVPWSTRGAVRPTRLDEWPIQRVVSGPANSRCGRLTWTGGSRACWEKWDAAKRTVKIFSFHPMGSSRSGQLKNSCGLRLSLAQPPLTSSQICAAIIRIPSGRPMDAKSSSSAIALTTASLLYTISAETQCVILHRVRIAIARRVGHSTDGALHSCEFPASGGSCH